MTKIELFDDDIFGILVQLPTGVLWTNQVGGVSCCHPEIEGIFVPLCLPPEKQPQHMTDIAQIHDWYKDDYAGYVIIASRFRHAFTQVSSYYEMFKVLSEDEWLTLHKKARVAAEAWIPFKLPKEIFGNEQRLPISLETFAGQVVVLTYWNSD